LVDAENNVRNWYLVYKRRHQAALKYEQQEVHFVENCEHIELTCPLVYEELQAMNLIYLNGAKERLCDTCDRNVYHCETKEEVDEYLKEGKCISMFKKNDLEDILEPVYGMKTRGNQAL
jgi:hypothetical protein